MTRATVLVVAPAQALVLKYVPILAVAPRAPAAAIVAMYAPELIVKQATVSEQSQ